MSVRRSLAWTYLAQAISFLVTFGSTIIVARLVSPRDFGIFGMVNAIAAVISVFMSFHLAKYIMREKVLTVETLRSLFTANVVLSLVYITAILAGALATLTFTDTPEVARFLFVFTLFPVFSMLQFLPAALCTREMRFGVHAAMAVLRAIVMAATTIILAMNGYAYMSFAWAQVLAWLATAIGYNVLLWRPEAYRLRFKQMKSIISFGTQMMGITGLNALSVRAGEMSLGSMLGLASLGLYTRAISLPTQLYQNVFGAGSSVIFSRLSEDIRSGGNLHSTYLRFMRVLLGLLWPMMIGIAVLAQPIIHVLYGEQWQPAATPLALLTVATAIKVAIGMTTDVFILRKQTAQQVKIESLRAGAGFLLFVAGAMFSLTLAAASRIAEAVIAFLLYHRPMNRLVGAPAGDLRRIYVEGLLLTGVAVLPALLLMVWSDWSRNTPLPLIVAAIVVGAVLWVACIILKKHPIASEVVRLLKRTA